MSTVSPKCIQFNSSDDESEYSLEFTHPICNPRVNHNPPSSNLQKLSQFENYRRSLRFSKLPVQTVHPIVKDGLEMSDNSASILQTVETDIVGSQVTLAEATDLLIKVKEGLIKRPFMGGFTVPKMDKLQDGLSVKIPRKE